MFNFNKFKRKKNRHFSRTKMWVEFILLTISLKRVGQIFSKPVRIWLLPRKSVGWKSSQSCFPLRPSRTKHHARAATINRLSPWRRQEIQKDTESYYQCFKEEGKHSHVQLRPHARKYLTFPIRMRHGGRCIYSFHPCIWRRPESDLTLSEKIFFCSSYLHIIQTLQILPSLLRVEIQAVQFV